MNDPVIRADIGRDDIRAVDGDAGARLGDGKRPVPAGRAANASSIGAKTVSDPPETRASTRPAACAAASKVLKLPACWAVSTMLAALAGEAAKVMPTMTNADAMRFMKSLL
jgi:hypothetical protein